LSSLREHLSEWGVLSSGIWRCTLRWKAANYKAFYPKHRTLRMLRCEDHKSYILAISLRVLIEATDVSMQWHQPSITEGQITLRTFLLFLSTKFI
jgi:hypothetical protein